MKELLDLLMIIPYICIHLFQITYVIILYTLEIINGTIEYLFLDIELSKLEDQIKRSKESCQKD